MKLQILSLLQLAYAHSGSALSSSSNDIACSFDPFYYLRPTPLPICSLTLQRSTGAEASTELLSFEEWKQAQLAAAQKPPTTDTQNASRQHAGAADSEDAETPKDPSGMHAGEASSQNKNGTRNEFRVPLKDRFNYAAQDCTARIHSSHKGAKSPSSVLSNKKDKYMLSQCNAKSKYVIVELCDDVRIDTVQLANYEFFSGVFKDIRISLSESAPGDPLSWIDAGTYRAKNVRGVQSFHPSEGRRTFYRYIRIDFLSHYGNEYYCPVSLLRVYGLTHMEDYKWAGWQTGDEIPGHVEMTRESITTTGTEAVPEALSAKALELGAVANGLVRDDDTRHGSATLMEATPSPPTSSEGNNASTHPIGDASPEDEPRTLQDSVASLPVTILHVTPTPHIPEEPVATHLIITGGSFDSVIERSATAKPETPHSIISDLPIVTQPIHVTPPPPPPPSATISSTIIRSITSSLTPPAGVAPNHVSNPNPNPNTGGGENIYRTIMNRLFVLETNSTLGMRYMEEQTRSMRHVVQKLEEDVGRLQGLGKSQQRLLERAIMELEQQKKAMDEELSRLATDIQTLSREVIIEKRLGFLQLCLLIFLFVFMTLTRGSRESTTAARVRNTISSWPSGDWAKWRKIAAAESETNNRNNRQQPDAAEISTALEKAIDRRSSEDIFAPSVAPAFPIAGPSTSPIAFRPLAPFRTPLSPLRSSHHGRGLPRQGGRPRVTSTPSLPVVRGGRPNFSKKNTSHLHEVVAAPYRDTRVAAQVAQGASVEDGSHIVTPRIRRTTLMASQVVRPSPLRSSSRKGKNRDRAGSVEVDDDEYNDEKGQRREDQEISPASTVAAHESESADESGAWEDTSTEAEDELEEDGPQSDVNGSPRPQSAAAVGSSDVRLVLGKGKTTSFLLSHPLKTKFKPGHQPSMSQETVRVRS
ncbi:hypothetical protein FRB93_013123 [Tulasnella sp. JGI-2019a]|nr:hypothetical protein FRB93_013123 [Tulasnella sp. JGI-2019a]